VSRSLLVRRSFAAATASLALLASLGTTTTTAAPVKKTAPPVTVHLGYFPNVTHASAIVGVEGGLFRKALGKNALATSTFNAGGDEVQALLSGALDIGYIGPSPAINAWAKSKAIRIISGSASGGAFLVVKPDIKSAADLKGKKVADPQLGATQDVALRTWLASKGLKTDTSGGGDVSVVPQENAVTLQTFVSNAISGAWVPEPWATRLVNEGNGKVLVNEADLWPGGRYVTTQVIVQADFLRRHPDVVKQVIAGQVAANDSIKSKPAQARQLVARGIEKVTGKPIKPDLVAASFQHITFTNDPIASSLATSAKHAVSLGLIKPVNLNGIYDLELLNQVLTTKGQKAIKAT